MDSIKTICFILIVIHPMTSKLTSNNKNQVQDSIGDSNSHKNDENYIDGLDDYESDYGNRYTYNFNSIETTSNFNNMSAYPDSNVPISVPLAKFPPRLVRVFGGFLKEMKVNIEGRVYISYNNQFCQYKDVKCTTIDIGFNYELPNNPYDENLKRRGRKIESDHLAVFETIEGLFNKANVDGKSCILRLICELAESRGLPYNGLLGKTIEILFLIDYGMSNAERLFDYIRARTVGETQGNCSSSYHKCPFSVFNVLEPKDSATN